MPRLSATGPLDVIHRQIRRVRWRRNLHVLQEVVYLALAAIAGSAAIVLLVALRGGPRLFASAALAMAVGTGVAVLVLTRTGWRKWLRAERSAEWVDRKGDLQGRLATLVELDRRGLAGQPAFFLPLLEEENVARLPSWDPERLVPDNIPVGALGTALAAVAALVLVLALAPRLLPRLPEIVYRDEPVGLASLEGLPRDPDRLLIAPRAWGEGAGKSAGARGSRALATPGGEEGNAAAFGRLGDRLQERIRERLWGNAWTRMREEIARAERQRATQGSEHASPARRSRRHEDRDTAAADAARAARAEAGRAEGAAEETKRAEGAQHAGADEQTGGAGGAAGGAGSATDPHLFGTPFEAEEAGDNTFELAIAARVRALRMDPRRPSGEPPPLARDARPALAARQRQEAATHRMPAPPAYESIVRTLFAHRETAP
jgi:hypothetical protein